MKIFRINILFFVVIFLHFGANAQDIDYDFENIQLLCDNNKKTEVLSELNYYHKIASITNDTLALLKIYDYYIAVFELDTVNNNEKTFILKKIFLEKNYIKNHSQNKDIYYDLLETYNKLVDYYILRNEYYIAIDVYYSMINVAEVINDLEQIAKIFSEIGVLYQKSYNYSDALENFNKSKAIGRELADSIIVIDNIILTGDLFLHVGEYSNAIYKYYEAVVIAKFTDNLEEQSEAYVKLAEAFYILELYSKAIEYSNKSLDLYQDSSVVFDNLILLNRYIFLGKNYLALDSIDLAINNFNNALFIAQTNTDEKNIALIYSFLGIAHTKNSDYFLAKNFLSKSLLIRNKIGDSLDICRSKLAFGEFYFKKGDLAQAKFFLINAIKTAEKINNHVALKEISLLLAEIYEKEQNFEFAYKYHQLYVNANDSLFKNNNISVEKLEAEFEFRENNGQIKQEFNSLNKRKKELTIFVVLLAFLLLLFIVLVIFFVLKNKEASRSKLLIEKQKQIILKQYERFKMLSLVASNTDNSIFIVNSNWMIEWVNEALLALYKTTHYEIFTILKADYKKLTNGDIEAIKQTCLLDNQPYSFISNININGVKKWIQTTISPVIEDDVVVNLIGIETDITSLKIAQFEIQKQKKDIQYKNKLMDIYNQELKEQKEAIVAQNEELRQQQEELQAHTDLLEEYNHKLQRLSFVASETDNIVSIFDLDGNIVWVNKAFVKYTGYSLEEYISEYGQNIFSASTIDAIDYYFYTCLEQKRSVKYVSKLKTKFGKVIWVQTTLTPLKNKQGEVIEVVGIDADITDIKKAERKITEQHLEIKSSVEYAGRIQRSVLPMPIFIKAIFEKYFIFNRPRDIVSGDFYFTHFYNNKAIFALADSTGHGIPGAFMSLLGTMALKIVVTNLDKYEPSGLLENLNNEMIRLLHQRGHKTGSNDSIDMAFCVFDFEKHTLDFAGANIPLFIARKNTDAYSINRIKPNKATIGYDSLKKAFTVKSFKLENGDRIYLTTDGLNDQFGGINGKKLKRKGVVELLEQINKLDIEEQENALDTFMNNWMRKNDQVDDIMVVGIEYQK